MSMLFALGIVAPAMAQIIRDIHAPAGQQPTVLTAPNNVPLINIQTPSPAGVSRNTYSQFDVSRQGAILNNSRGNFQTSLGGWVQGNPWIANGSARVILNEVNASNPSQLNGTLEVAGQRAQVIVANPAGINCDGCGFINASRATLSTGTPLMNGGSLDGYRVQGGTVHILGGGVDASTTDYTDIIARAVRVEAGIWARQLNVVSGANQVATDPASGDTASVMPIAGQGAAPRYAIDTGVLGGMYAGKITLVATEAGAGIRQEGALHAGVGDVVVTAEGRLSNVGQIRAAGKLRLDSQAGIANSGDLYALSSTVLSTRGDLENAGTLAAYGDVTLAATGAQSRITTTSGSTLAAGMREDGSMAATGTLLIEADASVTARGRNFSAGLLQIGSRTIDLASGSSSAGSMALATSTGDIDLSQSTTRVSNMFTASAAQALRTDGASLAAGQLDLLAQSLSNIGGQLSGNGSFRLATGSLVNRDGIIEAAGADHPALHISAGAIDNRNGTLLASGPLHIDTSGLLANHDGIIQATGGDAPALRIKAGALDNSHGKLFASDQLRIDTTGSLVNREGIIQAAGGDNPTLLISAGTVDNGKGKLFASGPLHIDAASLDNSEGQINSVASLTVNSASTVINRQGQLAANRALTVAAGQIDNSGGNIASVHDSVGLQASGALYNQGGSIAAATGLLAQAPGIDNQDGTMAGTTLTLDSQGQEIDNRHGRLLALGAGSGDFLKVTSGQLNNDHGLIRSAGALHLDTGKEALINTGTAEGLGIVAQAALDLRTAAFDNRQGYAGSLGDLRVDAGLLDNTQAGQLVSNAATRITATSLRNQSGQIQSLADLTIRSGAGTGSGSGAGPGIDNSAGLIRSGKLLDIVTTTLVNANTLGTDQGIEGETLSITADQIDNRSGAMRANDSAQLKAKTAIDNSQGWISAARSLNVVDGSLLTKTLAITNTHGDFIAGEALTIDSARLGGDGRVASLGNLDIRLTGDFVNTGSVKAAGNACIETTGTLDNQAVLAAGNSLSVKATTLNNQAEGRLQATIVDVDSATLVNHGLVDGGQTRLRANLLNNLGTGRIYGDEIAISATTLNNLAEVASAPVIAARERLDLGVSTLNNNEHALVYSAGDLAIGGALDADHHASGQASVINNTSATIEAAAGADIGALVINNHNAHFSTGVEQVSSTKVIEYQGTFGGQSGQRYLAGTPGVQTYDDESLHLRTPERDYEQWYEYKYTRNVSETRIQSSDPSQILSGGDMRLRAQVLNNENSHVIAGGALRGEIAEVNNKEVEGVHVETDSGERIYHFRRFRRGTDVSKTDTVPWAPAPTRETIALTPFVYQGNRAVVGSNPQIAPLSSVTIGQAPAMAGKTVQATLFGQPVTPVTQVFAADGTPGVIRSGSVRLGVPDNRLFRVTPEPGTHYLVETDPAFASYRTWISSDYLLKALGIDGDALQKRLGDGFYEQRLIREQVAQLTGQRFIEGYADDETQYQALMQNGATYAGKYQLVPGLALSAQQMAQLTSDLVWLVAQDIALPDGSVTRALVPQLYVHVRDGDLQAGGALIAADNVRLDVSGELRNSGTIAARKVVNINADHLANLGGRIAGQDVAVQARTDLNNIGGTIVASDSLLAMAGRDLNVESVTRTQSNAQGQRTNVERVAGLYVTGRDGSNGTSKTSSTNVTDGANNNNATNTSNATGGKLVVSAGRDVNLTAALIVNGMAGNAANASSPAPTAQTSGATAPAPSSQTASNNAAGTTTIIAGNDIRLGTVTQSQSDKVIWDDRNHHSESRSSDTGSAIQSVGDIALRASHDLDARAASVTSSQGSLTAIAGNDIRLSAGQSRHTDDLAHEQTGRTGGGNKLTITTRGSSDRTTSLASTFSADTTTLLAKHDLVITGSNVVSDKTTTLVAQNDLTIRQASDTSKSSSYQAEKRSGLLSSGGFGFTVGTRKQSLTQDSTETTASASSIGSTGGSVVLQGGRTYTQSGSDVLAPQGDIDIVAQRVHITEARENARSQTATRFSQSGLTVAVTSPVITALQTVEQMHHAAGNTSDTRMKALAAANVAMVGKNSIDAIRAGQGATIDDKTNQIATGNSNPDGTAQTRDATAADKVGGINLSISVGSSKSSSNTTQTSESGRQSTIVAGNDVRIDATGAGQDSRLTIQGSNVVAGNIASLHADQDIELLAAQRSSARHSDSKSSSTRLGVSVGTAGANFTVSASRARGNADGSDVGWDNTHVTAGQKVHIESGADTRLSGAVVAAPRITAEVGKDLLIESRQDTSKFDSRQRRVGGSLSIGAGTVSGSLNAGKSNIDSDFASVSEQSGMKAGDQEFDVRVGNDTTLKGGLITSTQQAVDKDRNQFRTQRTLAHGDIENKASYSADSMGINIGKSIDPNGKLTPGGTSAGIGSDSGSAKSTTRSAISGIAGDRSARTGDKEAGIAPVFDAAKVQKEIDAQVQITQTFGREAPRAIANYAAGKMAEINRQLGTETDPTRTKALIAKKQNWEEGGVYRVALHTAAGGLAGNVSGAVGSATAAVSAPALSAFQDRLSSGLQHAGLPASVADTSAQVIAATTAAGMGAAAGGGNSIGAVTAFNTDSNNRQLHLSEAQKLDALKQGKSKAQQDRLDAAACALVRCGDGVPPDDPQYAQLQALQQLGSHYLEEQSALSAIGEFEYQPNLDVTRDTLTRNGEATHRLGGAANLALGVMGTLGGSTIVATGASGCAPSIGASCALVPVGTYIATISAQQAIEGNRDLVGPYTSTEGQRVLASFSPEIYPGERDPLIEIGIDVTTSGLSALAGKIIPKGLIKVGKEKSVGGAGFETSNLQSKLEGYLLDAAHPQNQTKANWFKQALGFDKSNWKDLASQLKFNEATAVQTKVTQYGTTFEQSIPLIGANGNTINTTFVFMKDTNGVVRLVTGLPTKK